MDRRDDNRANEFSLDEFRSNTQRVMDHALAHGIAVIRDAEGRVRALIDTRPADPLD